MIKVAINRSNITPKSFVDACVTDILSNGFSGGADTVKRVIENYSPTKLQHAPYISMGVLLLDLNYSFNASIYAYMNKKLVNSGTVNVLSHFAKHVALLSLQSKFTGIVGEKYMITGMVLACAKHTNYFVISIVDSDKNLHTIYYNANITPSAKVEFTGTISAHSTYNGVDSTVYTATKMLHIHPMPELY